MRWLAALLTLSFAHNAAAESSAFPKLSVETDPTLFLQDGYSFSIGGSAAAHWHIQYSQFAFNLYGFATPAGFDARVDRGNFLWFKYYVHPNNEGLFTGLALSVLSWDYTRPDTPGAHALQDQYGALPFVGYRWFPAANGLYVLPWAGVGIPFRTVGDTMVGGAKYEPKYPVFPLLAVHIGYEWGR